MFRKFIQRLVAEEVARHRRIDEQVARDRADMLASEVKPELDEAWFAGATPGPDTTARVLPVIEQVERDHSFNAEMLKPAVEEIEQLKEELPVTSRQQPTTNRIPNAAQQAAIKDAAALLGRGDHPVRPVAETPRRAPSRQPIILDTAQALDLRAIKERTK